MKRAEESNQISERKLMVKVFSLYLNLISLIMLEQKMNRMNCLNQIFLKDKQVEETAGQIPAGLLVLIRKVQ